MSEIENKMLLMAFENALIARSLSEAIRETITDNDQRAKIKDAMINNIKEQVKTISSELDLELSEKLQSLF